MERRDIKKKKKGEPHLIISITILRLMCMDFGLGKLKQCSKKEHLLCIGSNFGKLTNIIPPFLRKTGQKRQTS